MNNVIIDAISLQVILDILKAHDVTDNVTISQDSISGIGYCTYLTLKGHSKGYDIKMTFTINDENNW